LAAANAETLPLKPWGAIITFIVVGPQLYNGVRELSAVSYQLAGFTGDF